MRSGYATSLCAVLFALVGCVAEDGAIEDLGTISDGKSDTVLPRSAPVELAPGAVKRFRIKTAAFVASLAQTGDVEAELTAKHTTLEYGSDVSRAPLLEATGDGSVRTWTLAVDQLP